MKKVMTFFLYCLFCLSFLAQSEAKEVQLSEEKARALQVALDSIIILYVGMPEKEFVKHFTKDESFEGTLKPYITKHVKNIYYLKCPYFKLFNKLHGSVNRPNERVTFKNGKLVKYETQYRAQPPFMFLVYGDDTYLLDGYQYYAGLYKGMPEEEFLKNFSRNIHPDSNYDRGLYIVTVTNNVVYTVSFENKKLDYARRGW